MIRGIFILLECLLLLIMSIILIPIAWLLRFKWPLAIQTLSQKLTSFYSWLALKISGTRIDIIGRENIPDEPCLYVANHRSYFDIIMTMPILRPRSFYIAKQEVGKIPFFRFWMLSVGCLLLDRSDMKQQLKVILKAIDQVKAGYSCFIFPEGHRTKNPNHEMEPFKEGSFKIASKANVPICPIAILNSRAIFENQAPKFKKAHCIIVIDKPVYPDKLSEEDRKHPGAYCQEIIRKNIESYQDKIQTL